MNNTYASKNIKQIEFDLTSSCNAACPSCSRHIVKQDGETYLNEYINYNQNISVETITDIFSSKYIDPEVSVDLVGSIGDPLANPKILDIVKEIIRLKPNCFIVIHTNGGLKTPTLFLELSRTLSGHGSIWFSIDGLEDTNHIYRKNVRWEKVFENLKACISGGVTVKWQFIKFPWNAHQVDQAQKLADELGVGEFFVRESRICESEMNYYLQAHERGFHGTTKEIDDKKSLIVSRELYSGIEPECFNDKRMYINSDAVVVPCCVIATSMFEVPFRDEYYEFLQEFGENWNNLNYNSFDSVVEGKYWDKLWDSVQDITPLTMSKCVEKCGKPKFF